MPLKDQPIARIDRWNTYQEEIYRIAGKLSMLGRPPSDEWGGRILDVGCGADPMPYATTILEPEPGEDLLRISERVGRRGRADFYPCSLEDFEPPKGIKWDWVHCSHVLEHVRDPIAFCRRLEKLGKRGYLETPTALSEALFGSAQHRWIFRVDSHGTLRFRALTPTELEHPFGDLFYRMITTSQGSHADRFRAIKEARHDLWYMSYFWEGRIDIEEEH